MSDSKNSSICFTILSCIAVLLGALGYLWHIDRKRVSDPKYKVNINEKRKATKLATKIRLEYRLDSMPDPCNPKCVQQFILEKFDKANNCADLGEERIAAECIADALFMMSCCTAKKMITKLSNTTHAELHQMICEEYEGLKSTCATKL